MPNFRSKFEKRLAEGPLKGMPYESFRLPYEVHSHHFYTPDFSFTKGKITYLIEAKGRFKSRAEANKYIHIREYIKKDTELIFILMKSSVFMPGAQRRKDGTKQTMVEWLEKNNFKWFTAETIVKFIKEK